MHITYTLCKFEGHKFCSNWNTIIRADFIEGELFIVKMDLFFNLRTILKDLMFLQPFRFILKKETL